MAEKRLIDANALKVKAFPDPDSGEGLVYVQDIDEAPTVDAVEVVRCKDCGHRTENGMCPMISGCPDLVGVDDDFFCKYGKRRTEDA